ncbi:MAG: tRNA pseudouridine(38-40) synthase TruA [Acidimicrobiales bacterium]
MGERTGADGSVVGTERPGDENRARTRRVALGLAYDGSGYHGFAVQPGQRTVGGELCAALEQMSGRALRCTCAGRTDSGVHATAQVVHVDLDEAFLAGHFGAAAVVPGRELPKLAEALSHQLGPEIVVWRALVAPEGFDARRSAIARRYRYDLELGGRPDPLRRQAVWHLEAPVDVAAMRLAADAVLGEHDFAAFCRRPPDKPDGPIRRRVTDARLTTPGEGLWRFEIESDAFCHQMVRSIVGALAAVGTGRLRPSDLVALLARSSRAGAPPPAPPGGLCLVAVRYPAALTGTWS